MSLMTPTISGTEVGGKWEGSGTHFDVCSISDGYVMKNLSNLSNLTDNEFLAFLYSERDRQGSKGVAPGWSLWALIGTVFALEVYIYSCLKDIESIDFLLCYYIFVVFCPIVLYGIFICEQIRAFQYGDSMHVTHLKDSAPINLLVSLSVIYAIIAGVGYCLGADFILVIFSAAVLFPIAASLFSIWNERYKLVATINMFRVSANDKCNRVLMFFISGTLLLPTNRATKHLAFGFSEEFKVTFAIVLIIGVFYLIIQDKANGQNVSEIDELIDGFLYYDWTKQAIVRKLELVKLGKAPFMELEEEYRKLVETKDRVIKNKERVEKIAARIKEEGIEDEGIEGLFAEIKEIDKSIGDVLSCQQIFSEKAKELLLLKTTLRDSNFKTMLETAYDFETTNQLFQDCRTIMDIMKTQILSAIEKHSEELKNMVCSVDCPHRINKDRISKNI